MLSVLTFPNPELGGVGEKVNNTSFTDVEVQNQPTNQPTLSLSAGRSGDGDPERFPHVLLGFRAGGGGKAERRPQRH